MPEDSLSIRFVRVLVDGVEHRGVTRSDFLHRAKWDPQRLAVVEGRVPWSELGRLSELAIDLTGDPALGLHTIKAIRTESVDLVAQLVARAPTARDAFESLLRLHKLLDDECRLQLKEAGRDATLRYECPGGLSARATRYVTEINVHGLYALLHYFARHARPTRVSFAYRAPSYRAEYRRVFQGIERFDQPFTGIVFDRALMDAAPMYHDEELHRTVRELAASRVLRLTHGARCVDRVRDVLARHEAPSAATMFTVARALSISTRTLRRQLAAEGTSYDAVAQAALAQRARTLLTVERRTIRETALALGYSDASAFHRAFKRWTGTTPSACRADGAAAGRERTTRRSHRRRS
jgi:AraC-like DNA-binding protein